MPTSHGGDPGKANHDGEIDGVYWGLRCCHLLELSFLEETFSGRVSSSDAACENTINGRWSLLGEGRPAEAAPPPTIKLTVAFPRNG